MWSIAIIASILLFVTIVIQIFMMSGSEEDNVPTLIFLIIALFLFIIIASVGWVGKNENIPPKQDPLSAKIVNITRTNNVVLVTYLYLGEEDDEIVSKAGVIKKESAKIFNTSDDKLYVKREIVTSLYGDEISDEFELVTIGD